MVSRKNLKSNALISVYDKSNLKELCASLTRHGISIISTGNTAKKIKSLGYKCKEVSDLTKFKEILDGRVKTLHPKIHASLLYDRKNINHLKTFNNLNFPQIDYVIVSFYPFSTIFKRGYKDKKIEMIDIGGPSMIRSASKNFKYVTTICKTAHYSSLIKELDKNMGTTTLAFREKMAKRNFKITSDYDLSIFKWFNDKKTPSNKIKLKYGENPNQKAFFIQDSKKNIFSSQLAGKDLGYNNILDISEGKKCLNEFEEPTCVIVKHNNPCGVASAVNIKTAFVKAMKSDPISAFGGVILFNRKIDDKLAKKINNEFFEVVVAPNISIKILKILKNKKKLIIIDSSKLKNNKKVLLKSVYSGTLLQEENSFKVSKSELNNVFQKKVSKKILEDLIFSYKVAKHVKSNAIVFAQNKQTLGIGLVK